MDRGRSRYDPERHHRRSIRLEGYDYRRPGAYFVTICTQERVPYFYDARIRALAEACWEAIPDHAPLVELDEWVVMPNHVHGILVLTTEWDANTGYREAGGGDHRRDVQLNVPTPRNPNDPYSVMSPLRNFLHVIVRTFKAAVTARCRRQGFSQFGWQPRFHDHIIRDDDDLNRIRQYIVANPENWPADDHYVAATGY